MEVSMKIRVIFGIVCAAIFGAAVWLVPVVTETALKGPEDMPNSAYVTPDYPNERIPWFIDIDDRRRSGEGHKAMFLRRPATDGYELRVYPQEIEKETAVDLMRAKMLIGLDCYVGDIESPDGPVVQ